MRLRVIISEPAEADLAHQYRWYVEKAGVEVAERFLAGFDVTMEKLSCQPGLGRIRKFRARELAGIRSFPVGGSFAVHLVFYRHQNDFSRDSLNDVICIPFWVPIMLFIMKKAGLRREDGPPTGSEILIPLIL